MGQHIADTAAQVAMGSGKILAPASASVGGGALAVLQATPWSTWVGVACAVVGAVIAVLNYIDLRRHRRVIERRGAQ